MRTRHGGHTSQQQHQRRSLATRSLLVSFNSKWISITFCYFYMFTRRSPICVVPCFHHLYNRYYFDWGENEKWFWIIHTCTAQTNSFSMTIPAICSVCFVNLFSVASILCLIFLLLLLRLLLASLLFTELQKPNNNPFNYYYYFIFLWPSSIHHIKSKLSFIFAVLSLSLLRCTHISKYKLNWGNYDENLRWDEYSAPFKIHLWPHELCNTFPVTFQ